MSDAQRRYWRSVRWLTAALLTLWLVAAFGVVYFARALSFGFFGWTFGFWWAAQGALLVFVALVVIYQVAARRLDEGVAADEAD
ncbi:sodium/substrate symporter small subunit [Ideonella aquatica]|uniref:sodium/substrate symporter small subunit n=1 Tax=Ideonella aquatica TaxID=2824119 RepID=UPI002872C10C|nr:sodium/substrate symporter small subunit [Ideonella aquatica]